MLRGIFISILLAALAAGAWGEWDAYAGNREDLIIAADALETALEVYDEYPGQCYSCLITAIDALERSNEERSHAGQSTAAAAYFLPALYRITGKHSVLIYEVSAEEAEKEKATIYWAVTGLNVILGREPVTAKPPESYYENLRVEVKANEAAGKGDVTEQIMAMKFEAARLNLKADVYEAENRKLEERARRVEAVISFWKTIIGEDQAKLFPWR